MYMKTTQQFISIQELKKEGYSYYDINKMTDSDRLA